MVQFWNEFDMWKYLLKYYKGDCDQLASTAFRGVTCHVEKRHRYYNWNHCFYFKAIIFESYYIWKLMYLKALLLHLKARLPEFSIAYTYTYENRPKSLNALYNYPTMHRFVKKYVHTCAQFCFKLVYCGIWDWGTVGFVRPVWLLYTQLHSGSLHVFYWM